MNKKEKVLLFLAVIGIIISAATARDYKVPLFISVAIIGPFGAATIKDIFKIRDDAILLCIYYEGSFIALINCFSA